MKTKLLTFALLSSLLLGVQTTHAQDSVYSNVVGMVKVTIQPGDIAFIANPFISGENDEFIVEEVFQDLPANTRIYVWNSDSQVYTTITNNPLFGWPNSETYVNRGQGLFIAIGGDSAEEVIVSGNVPDESLHSSTEITIKPGITAFGFPYPVETTIEDSGLAEKMNVGDVIYIWNQEAQGYTTIRKTALFGVSNPEAVISAGGSVFFVSASNVDTAYVAAIPYSLNN